MESTVKCISFDFTAARTTRHLMDGDFFDPILIELFPTFPKQLKGILRLCFFLLGFGKIRHVWKTPTPPDSIVKMRFKFKIRKFFF